MRKMLFEPHESFGCSTLSGHRERITAPSWYAVVIIHPWLHSTFSDELWDALSGLYNVNTEVDSPTKCRSPETVHTTQSVGGVLRSGLCQSVRLECFFSPLLQIFHTHRLKSLFRSAAFTLCSQKPTRSPPHLNSCVNYSLRRAADRFHVLPDKQKTTRCEHGHRGPLRPPAAASPVQCRRTDSSADGDDSKAELLSPSLPCHASPGQVQTV